VIAVQAHTDDDLLDRAMLTPADLSVVTSGAVHRQVRSLVARAAPVAYDWGSPGTPLLALSTECPISWAGSSRARALPSRQVSSPQSLTLW
jgi:hypothetical protein